MEKLGKFDLKLLTELEKNSRQTLSQIGRKLKTSQQRISYRIKSLEKRNIIGGYYTIIDFTKFGYTSYRTMIRFSNINPQKYNEIISYLIEHKNVLWVVECLGRWDLIANFMAKNIIHYSHMLREFKNKFPEQIQNYDVLTTVEIIYFGRNYFMKNKPNIPLSFGDEWKITKIDKKNLEILSLLAKNARITVVEMGAKLHMSPNTIILRIKEMKKNGIIKGFKPLIHLENTPYEEYKALIKFHNITDDKEKEIINYLKTCSNVIGIIRLVGLWDFEIEFGVKTKKEMLDFTRNFRDRFKEVIRDFEVIQLFHEYKYNFLPGDLVTHPKQI